MSGIKIVILSFFSFHLANESIPLGEPVTDMLWFMDYLDKYGVI